MKKLCLCPPPQDAYAIECIVLCPYILTLEAGPSPQQLRSQWQLQVLSLHQLIKEDFVDHVHRSLSPLETSPFVILFHPYYTDSWV